MYVCVNIYEYAIYMCIFICRIFVHFIVCLTTSPQPLPKRVLHGVRSSASSFSLQCPLFSLSSFSSCLRLLLRLTFNLFCLIFPSLKSFSRQFLRKMWPIQLAVLLYMLCRIFLSSLTFHNTSSFSTRSVQLIFYIFLHHRFSKVSR
jgi:hypothetical protein